MGKVDQRYDAIDHGIAECNQGIGASQGDAVDELLEKHAGSSLKM